MMFKSVSLIIFILANNSSINAKDQKIALASLLSLLLEATKHDAHPTAVRFVIIFFC